MVMMRVRTIFSGVPGTPFYSNLYFNESGLAAPQPVIDAVAAFWSAAMAGTSEDLSWNVNPEVLVIDETDGSITGVLNGEGSSDDGNSSAELAPAATQGLVQYKSDTYLNSRRLQGRIFIPGIMEAMGAGVPTEVSRTRWRGAALGLLTAADTAGTPWVVYSRANGTLAEVTAVDAWTQYAVQRSRRD
uniref:Uncharacterized protein n=1 Tax=uncultured prokaryote TaxID=198431 RepID=A0A0H5Q7J5_9ZZZZ|nr:hypothetical protein [uncultured prokaryote]